MSLGVTEIVLILVVFLVLFGGKKIPELARGLGKAQAEYKKARETIENEVNEFKNEVAKAASAETTKLPAKKARKTTAGAAAKKKKTTGKTVKGKKTTAAKSNKKAAK